ncbi:MAG: nitrite reductase small subunit NirD [Acidimicrobiales bacterium]
MSEVVDDRTEQVAAVAVAPSVDGRAEGTRVCRLEELTPDRGAVALVRGVQVAVFRVRASDGSDAVYALGNLDPFSGAQVLSRGIVGDAGGVPKVASPVYKQAFDLRTGACLDVPDVSVPSYPATVDGDGWVWVEVQGP